MTLLKKHFSVCPGLVTDAAMGGEKGNATRLMSDTFKKIVVNLLLSDPRYRTSPKPN